MKKLWNKFRVYAKMVGRLKASQGAGTKKRIKREDQEKKDEFYQQAMDYARKTVAIEKKKFE